MSEPIADTQGSVEAVALLVATYYSALRRNGVPPEEAVQLAALWQASMVQASVLHAHAPAPTADRKRD